jgi:hypothetical protein
MIPIVTCIISVLEYGANLEQLVLEWTGTGVMDPFCRTLKSNPSVPYSPEGLRAIR